MKEIPVIIHHEGNQKYLKYSIMQAEKWNKKVYLFGDDSNNMFCENWIDCSTLESDRWKAFLHVFQNMSTYDEEYARQIFKRFFLLETFFERYSFDACVLIDSDVLVYQNFEEYTPFNPPYIASLSIPKKQDDYRWTANTGCSYWTKQAVTGFIDFCMDMYTNKISCLKEKYDYQKTHDLPGGVCEMSLLYLWYLQNTEKVLNTTRPMEGKVIDFNINLSENYELDDFLIDEKLKIKKMEFLDHIPFFIDKNGNHIQAIAMHFGGGEICKGYIKDIYLKERIPFYRRTQLILKMYWDYAIDRYIKKNR
ncbi:MAG: hypothetical protein ACI4S2_15280 [Lachnospiraceae bacterium]